jgi:GxxExxY protein
MESGCDRRKRKPWVGIRGRQQERGREFDRINRIDRIRIGNRSAGVVKTLRMRLMDHKEITEAIIGCAFRVYNTMGYGFLESVYENCMMIELKRAGLLAEAQKPITVLYDDREVGHFVADLLVEETVIVELKSVRSTSTAHEVQLVNYLTATGKPVGLLLNFSEKKVEVTRKVRTLPHLTLPQPTVSQPIESAFASGPADRTLPQPIDCAPTDPVHPVNPV